MAPLEPQGGEAAGSGFDLGRLREALRGVGGDARRTTPLYRQFHVRGAVASTNDEVLELARAGAPSATVVLADRQTAGRGRLDRRWFSPPGLNLYVSVCIRPPRPAPLAPTLYPLLAALAAADAVSFLGVRGVEIKWPNDLLVGGLKLAGILCEYADEPGLGTAVVFGVGLNVNMAPGDWPPYLQGQATSLRMCTGQAVERERALGLLLERLRIHWMTAHERGEFPWSPWNRYWKGVGTRVKAITPAGRLLGQVLGVSPDGGLTLQTDRGQQVTVLAGDVSSVDATE